MGTCEKTPKEISHQGRMTSLSPRPFLFCKLGEAKRLVTRISILKRIYGIRSKVERSKANYAIFLSQNM
jgi:hypothetical protein